MNFFNDAWTLPKLNYQPVQKKLDRHNHRNTNNVDQTGIKTYFLSLAQILSIYSIFNIETKKCNGQSTQNFWRSTIAEIKWILNLLRSSTIRSNAQRIKNRTTAQLQHRIPNGRLQSCFVNIKITWCNSRIIDMQNLRLALYLWCKQLCVPWKLIVENCRILNCEKRIQNLTWQHELITVARDCLSTSETPNNNAEKTD